MQLIQHNTYLTIKFNKLLFDRQRNYFLLETLKQFLVMKSSNSTMAIELT
jgi:hypothetical protein